MWRRKRFADNVNRYSSNTSSSNDVSDRGKTNRLLTSLGSHQSPVENGFNILKAKIERGKHIMTPTRADARAHDAGAKR
jgi:hypothetical protein